MEKRFYLGLGILLILLGLGLGSAAGMRTVHQPAQALLTQAARLTLEDSLEEALPLAEQAYAHWQDHRRLTASLADHSPMDETDLLFQELLVYGRAGEAPHFAACCRELTVMLEAIYDAHALSLKNLL